MTGVTIATSIAPATRLDVQRAAVASWLDCRFRVLSLNAPAEIAALEPSFPGVAFVPAPRTAQPFIGKPLVFISDLLDELAREQTPIVGLVNSDIRFERCTNLLERVASSAAENLLAGPRLDVRSWDDSGGRPDPIGFDAFFFPRTMIACWPATRFCLGQGYWDLWLPLAAILRGREVRKVLPPLARHLVHETNRDEAFFLFADEFATLASSFLQAAGPGDGFPKADYAMLRAAVETASGDNRTAALTDLARYIDALTRYVIRFIDANSTRIALSDQPS